MLLLAGAILVAAAGHLVVPGNRRIPHDLIVRLAYLPIVLGGIWFGLRGGMGAAAAVSLLVLPPLLLAGHDARLAGYLLEIPVFLGVGFLTGLITDRERDYRRGIEGQAASLAKSHQDLQQQSGLLLEKEAQLRRADRLSALGQLSAGLAHEIRNPLGAIKGAVEILQDDYASGHPKAEFFGIVLKEVERLNTVVTNFLSFARPAALALSPVELRGALTHLEGLISGQAHAHRVQVFTSFHGGPSRVMADEALLKQAFLNIMLNALEAMPDGGDLAIATRLVGGQGGRAGDEAQRPESVEVVFDDTGHGIAEPDLGRIFDPFFTTKKDGTGLGLAITYRIIENHRGSVRVASQPGRGTTFAVTLPLEGTVQT